MSVPYKIVNCSRCGYEQLSVILNRSYYWSDSKGREYSIGRELGVCNACKEVVAIEKFPALKDFQIAARAFRANRFKKAVMRFFHRPPLLTKDLKTEALSLDGRFAVLVAVMELGRDPVCLFCGSSDVLRLCEPDHQHLSETDWYRTNIKHPGCGGEFLVRSSGINRIQLIPSKNIYDIRGRLISGEGGFRMRE